MGIFNQFFKIVLISIVSLFFLRCFELVYIFKQYPFNFVIIKNEVIGFLYDIVIASAYLFLSYPIYYLLSKYVKQSFANVLFYLLILIFSITHLILLKYFIYQLIPLDDSLFKYDFKEVDFTIKSSGIGFTDLIIYSFTYFILFIFTVLKLKNKVLNPSKWIKILFALCLPFYLVINYYYLDKINVFTVNKTDFFINKSMVSYYNNLSSSNSTFSATDFQNMYPHKKFTSKEYPLIHQFEKDTLISTYFNEFDTTPNVVILMMEGLNDDYIHQYHGEDFMPFISGLKDSSLYWDRCFTLGERSYAIVPSITGGLPYGKLGFTLIDQYPNHLSLMSILKQNGYFTTFYYGQGSWFHHKGSFFKFNNIDLIIDYSTFDDSFKKIIVGEDNYFWGYNDKDLFTRSLMCVDSLNKVPRLDLYFSGSMHTPFVIADEEKYLKIAKGLIHDKDPDFYNTYANYLKALRFTDDALKDFFEAYKSKPGYDNTIFIITGDHPMTELPRANELKKYHVPLIIYSEKLKQPKTFHHIVSHFDVYESLLSLLEKHLEFVPEISTSLGSNLNDKNERFLVFMAGNREMVTCYDSGYFLHRNDLYKVNDDFTITPFQNDSIRQNLKNHLETFIAMNTETTEYNKIIPNQLYCQSLKYDMLFSDDTSKQVNLSDEYYNLTPKIKVYNQHFVYNIQFDYDYSPNDDISIIYQFSDVNDSVIYWSSSGMDEQTSELVNHFVYPKTADTLYFTSYVWNKNKSKTTLKQYHSLIYGYD